MPIRKTRVVRKGQVTPVVSAEDYVRKTKEERERRKRETLRKAGLDPSDWMEGSRTFRHKGK